ncbi:MAG: DUF1501 domain-containing protein [Acidimicrobiia bacterium]|nr:DUF1501 domain-containing protein [Acidimicrobiia bacterium]
MDFEELKRIQSRRSFLQDCAGGLGSIALWHLMRQEGRAGSHESAIPNVNPLRPKLPHYTPKARNVIFLFMAGAPSHIDLFDPKPALAKWEGKSLPDSMTKELRLAFIKPSAKVWASPRVFTRHGECGMEFSDFLPHTAARADDICMIRSMHSEQFNHHPGQLMLNCGTPLVGRPSMGAWITYGLGSESQNLPGFAVLSSGPGSSAGSGNWSSGFLPSSYQGVPFRNTGSPLLHLSNLEGVNTEDQRATLDAIRDLNEMAYSEAGDLEIASRIASYELAFRMQSAGPELLDFSSEPPKMLEMYGLNRELTRPFAANCLLARRMVERGVRFVQLVHSGWDQHSNLNPGHKKNCDITDQPTAALLTDLKQRGQLDETLVIWGGEFGRTPMVQAQRDDKVDTWGRDHHPLAFSLWMAGGGIKGGQIVGRTDDLGFNVVEDKVHIHDLHATILHCLGFDHKRLTYRHMGRDFRLTDIAGTVREKLLA